MHFPATALRAAPLLVLALLCALLPWSPVRAATVGELKTLVILVNFSDNPTQPKSRAEAHQTVFGSVSDFFWENSYQKAYLSGDTFGWFTIPVTSTLCDTARIAEEGNRAAAAAGADLAAYQNFIYLFPNNTGCGWSGTLGFGPRGEGRVFINAVFTYHNIAHELGHVFGLNHSDALDCGDAIVGDSCTVRGYGDQADTMGNRGAHFNAFQKEKLGWLGAAGTPSITTVNASGRYTIGSYESAGTAPKALKILKGTDPVSGQQTWYYVEYRQSAGFDTVLESAGNLARGVLVRTGSVASNGLRSSLLLDMTPNSNGISAYDVMDGALEVGRSHIDSAAGVTLTLVAADAGGATLDVSVPGGPAATCTRNVPILTVSAASTSATAGATLPYTVSLANRDSAACAATTFSLARSVPGGWTGTLGTTTLSLSPGTSATTILSVTSPGTATAGTYGIGAGASSSVGSVHVANAAAFYAVMTPAAGTLTESVSTDKSSYVRGETVVMSAVVRSNGVPAVGAMVRFTVIAPGGSGTTIDAVTGSDGIARASYRTGKGKSAAGSYGLRAVASSGGVTVTANSGFSVR